MHYVRDVETGENNTKQWRQERLLETEQRERVVQVAEYNLRYVCVYLRAGTPKRAQVGATRSPQAYKRQ